MEIDDLLIYFEYKTLKVLECLEIWKIPYLKGRRLFELYIGTKKHYYVWERIRDKYELCSMYIDNGKEVIEKTWVDNHLIRIDTTDHEKIKEYKEKQANKPVYLPSGSTPSSSLHQVVLKISLPGCVTRSWEDGKWKIQIL